MKTKVLDVITTTADGAGIWYGLSNIKEILGIIVLIVSLIGTCIRVAIAVINWYKKAKEDGKITKEELEEGVEIIKEGYDVVKDGIEQVKAENNDKKDE